MIDIPEKNKEEMRALLMLIEKYEGFSPLEMKVLLAMEELGVQSTGTTIGKKINRSCTLSQNTLRRMKNKGIISYDTYEGGNRPIYSTLKLIAKFPKV